jgi:hypothetical protein
MIMYFMTVSSLLDWDVEAAGRDRTSARQEFSQSTRWPGRNSDRATFHHPNTPAERACGTPLLREAAAHLDVGAIVPDARYRLVTSRPFVAEVTTWCRVDIPESGNAFPLHGNRDTLLGVYRLIIGP